MEVEWTLYEISLAAELEPEDIESLTIEYQTKKHFARSSA